MKKTIFRIFLLLLICQQAMAGHIAGGEIFYTWLSNDPVNKTDKYQITLRLFRDCAAVASGGQGLAPMPDQITVVVFDNTNNQPYKNSGLVTRTSYKTITLQKPYPCIINPRPVCYQVGEFSYQVDLAQNAAGYTAAFQTCCRSYDIVNVVKHTFDGGGQSVTGEGATYVADIPGANLIPAGAHNSSAAFLLKDTVLVCGSRKIDVDFSATDADGDSLSYSFCSAFDRGDATAQVPNQIPSDPPFNTVDYTTGFSGGQPLGSAVSINPVTGIISGTSPVAGVYVVNVCITEWRNGKAISSHRKDFSLKIAPCDFATVELPIDALTCDGFSMQFSNNSTSAQIHSYYWDFGVPVITTDSSTKPNPLYVYPDTGVFIAKLIVNKGEQCSDSGQMTVRVFPGFFPKFDVIGSCFSSPFKFVDKTEAKYGVVNLWRWNFGDLATTADTSRIQNPSYKYPGLGSYDVTLIVASSKGCIDTVTVPVQVTDKPYLNLPFKDTLICSIDTLKLIAETNGTGSFSWTPTANMLFPNSATPLVWPKDTTTYFVTYKELECSTTQSITVNVLDFITVNAGNDTTICRTDGIVLHPISHALGYKWTPVSTLNNPNIKNPIATPTAPVTTYTVYANLGKCQASDQITVTTVPYPIADAGPDTAICYKDTAFLHGNIVASKFNWSTASLVQHPNLLNTEAYPGKNSMYFILTVSDTLGCPKPVSDSVFVTVRPQTTVFAGNDTAIILGQPLQLHATSNANNFLWSPPTYLNNIDIANPVANINDDNWPAGQQSITYTVYTSTDEGCNATDDIIVKIFITPPSIFIPTAFTPNGDGLNEVFKPILAGISQLLYFKIYNRYGQVVYETSTPGQGWNGDIKGQPQSSSVFVYQCKAIDYKGKVISKNGTFTLIR